MQPSAPEPVIKASYRAMMQKLDHHPDRGGDVDFAKLLNAAAKTLCDPRTRAQYDALRKQFQPVSEENSGTETPDKTSWGEPGGSPDSEHDQSSDSGQHGHQSDIGTHSSGTSEPHANLPSRPQCPFCLSIYPADNTSFTTPAGYASLRRCRTCNSARTPIAHLPRTSDEELRRMHRQQHKSDARVWLSWPGQTPVNSALSNFSPEGCALNLSEIVAVGQTIVIDTGLFNAICKVRHCKPTGNRNYLVGLEFVTLDMVAEPGTLLDASA